MNNNKNNAFSSMDKIINYNTSLSTEIEKISTINKKIRIKFISLTLATILGSGLGFVVAKTAKKVTTIQVYPTKTINTQGNVTETYALVKDNPQDKVLVKEYSQIILLENGKNIRTVKEYDVTNYNLDKLEEYLNIDLTNLPYEQVAYFVNEDEENKSAYSIAEKTTVSKTIEERNNEFYEKDKEAIYAAYILLLLFIPKVGLSSIVKSLKNSINEKSTVKNNCLEYLNNIENNLNKIKEILKHNPELLNEFIQTYEDNIAIKNNLPKLLENIELLLQNGYNYKDAISITQRYIKTKRKQLEKF